MKIELTKEQKKHLESLEWLINGNRNSGRTYLLAITFIRRAIDNPGMWIQIFDHYPTQQAKEHLLDLIKMIICQDGIIFKNAEFRRGEFKINNKLKYHENTKNYTSNMGR